MLKWYSHKFPRDKRERDETEVTSSLVLNKKLLSKFKNPVKNFTVHWCKIRDELLSLLNHCELLCVNLINYWRIEVSWDEMGWGSSSSLVVFNFQSPNIQYIICGSIECPQIIKYSYLTSTFIIILMTKSNMDLKLMEMKIETCAQIRITAKQVNQRQWLLLFDKFNESGADKHCCVYVCVCVRRQEQQDR